ncbi:MAG: nucleotidyltransferase domain-containing protein [candidate division KSB1 bacterium]|nr:nucleotidyltransferase domain-containing protein [candidate division KSB1 bacterium]MDZ7369262.1 nucleotidyltransferase domain-containing protein [candidate division KSB1 bacterium]MDZ7407297.1 nucleotidyltransferase domain-containing protein [candidate division KSB1 bacterium]
MKSNSQLLALLALFAKGLRQLAGENIEKIILIGSHARGEQREDSDVDVVVLLKSSSEELRDRIYDYLVDFMLEHDVDISLKLIDQTTYQEWKEQSEPFTRSVEAEGIEV